LHCIFSSKTAVFSLCAVVKLDIHAVKTAAIAIVKAIKRTEAISGDTPFNNLILSHLKLFN